MHTTLDCLPCFLKQALKTSKIARPLEEDIHREIIYKCCQLIPALDLKKSPPSLAGEIYKYIKKITGVLDPYKKIKQETNQRALKLLPSLRNLISTSKDSLETALCISIIGNYIDSGIDKTFDWEKSLFFEKQELDKNILKKFKENIKNTSQIMILGDNSGEIALDILLIEELKKITDNIIYVVREEPIINDATIEDAKEVGLENICKVMSSGVKSPGTVLEECSTEFIQELNKSEVIISKGQGNFEALEGQRKGIFFAFKVKCPVVEKITKRPLGESIFIFK